MQRVEPTAVAPEVPDAPDDLVRLAVHEPHHVVHVVADDERPTVPGERESNSGPIPKRFWRDSELAHELALLGEDLNAIGLAIRDVHVVARDHDGDMPEEVLIGAGR